MKTCEKCRIKDSKVWEYHLYIAMFKAPDYLFSNYHYHEECAEGLSGLRRVKDGTLAN